MRVYPILYTNMDDNPDFDRLSKFYSKLCRELRGVEMTDGATIILPGLVLG